jgi:putative N6-adenine-specific DNA methylase
MSQSIAMPLFATCARGLEPVVAKELADLGLSGVIQGRGGVHFSGDLRQLYLANLWLRCAIRVLRPVLRIPVAGPDDLYDAVRAVDWAAYLTPDHTLAVDCNVRDSAITHSHYAALRVKDAICDQFIERAGTRPSVDVEEPMVGLNLHIYRNEAVLSLDSSGESLHKRGYRPIQTRAPLNEALAAGIVLLSGWNNETPLADPMCGSGTIPIEACWIAIHRPPGLTRHRFGFQGWLDFDVRLWTEVRDSARAAVGNCLPAPIAGSDTRADAIMFSRQNARAAGIGHLVTFTACDVATWQPPGIVPGTVICNPPYGERIGEEKDLLPLYQNLGKLLRTRAAGWTAAVFTGNTRLADAIGLTPADSIPLYNGKIPCRLNIFKLD